MKKLITIFFLLIYSFATVGATVRVHYCMEKFVGFELFHSNSTKDKCAKCGMKKSTTKKACCKDETKQIKIEKEYKLTASLNILLNSCSQKLVSFKTDYFATSLKIGSKFYHAPTFSLAKTVPIYVFDCTYRI
ncbi:MAG: hypothetical protein WCL56_12895 [Sediminibacterium sp.]